MGIKGSGQTWNPRKRHKEDRNDGKYPKKRYPESKGGSVVEMPISGRQYRVQTDGSYKRITDRL